MSRTTGLALGAIGAALLATDPRLADLAAVLAVALALAATCLGLVRRRPAARAAAATAIGFVFVLGRVALAGGMPPAPGGPEPLLPGEGPWAVRVESIASPRDGTQRFVGSLDGTDLRVDVTAPRYPVLVVGDRVEVLGALRAPPESPYGAYLSRIGVAATLLTRSMRAVDTPADADHVVQGIRADAGDALARALPEPAGGLAAGILIGLRERVDRDLAADFTTTGLSHVVAISGWNIAIVAGLVAALLGSWPRTTTPRGGDRRRDRPRHRPGRRVRVGPPRVRDGRRRAAGARDRLPRNRRPGARLGRGDPARHQPGHGDRRRVPAVRRGDRRPARMGHPALHQSPSADAVAAPLRRRRARRLARGAGGDPPDRPARVRQAGPALAPAQPRRRAAGAARHGDRDRRHGRRPRGRSRRPGVPRHAARPAGRPRDRPGGDHRPDGCGSPIRGRDPRPAGRRGARGAGRGRARACRGATSHRAGARAAPPGAATRARESRRRRRTPDATDRRRIERPRVERPRVERPRVGRPRGGRPRVGLPPFGPRHPPARDAPRPPRRARHRCGRRAAGRPSPRRRAPRGPGRCDPRGDARGRAPARGRRPGPGPAARGPRRADPAVGPPDRPRRGDPPARGSRGRPRARRRALSSGTGRRAGDGGTRSRIRGARGGARRAEPAQRASRDGRSVRPRRRPLRGALARPHGGAARATGHRDRHQQRLDRPARLVRRPAVPPHGRHRGGHRSDPRRPRPPTGRSAQGGPPRKPDRDVRAAARRDPARRRARLRRRGQHVRAPGAGNARPALGPRDRDLPHRPPGEPGRGPRRDGARRPNRARPRAGAHLELDGRARATHRRPADAGSARGQPRRPV